MSCRRPTVALVAHDVHDGGGMERVCAELIRRAGDRYRFVVVSNQLSEQLRAKVGWVRIPAPRRPFPLRFATFFVLGGLRLANLRVDLVHTVGALVPNRIDLASVHYCHAGFRRVRPRRLTPEPPLARRLNSGLARALSLLAERWSYRPGRIRTLAAVSEDVGRDLKHLYPGVRIVTTPNGVDGTRFRPDRETRDALRAEAGLGERSVVALFVGGDWDRKGLGLAIAGVADAVGRGAAELRLWVVGGGDQARFERYAERLGVARRVTFFGRRADVSRYYSAADVFVLPSHYEPFSLAALEAAAAGVPIVATPVNGIIRSLVGDGEAGAIVNGSAGELGQALVRLTGDPQRRTRMSQAARCNSCGFTWERSVEATLGEYGVLLKTAAGAG